MEANCAELEVILEDIFAQARQKGAAFEPTKTEMIHFSRTQKPHIAEINRPDIGLMVEPKSQIKWLEFIWNYRLSFKPHFETRQNLALTAFENIKRLATT